MVGQPPVLQQQGHIWAEQVTRVMQIYHYIILAVERYRWLTTEMVQQEEALQTHQARRLEICMVLEINMEVRIAVLFQ